MTIGLAIRFRWASPMGRVLAYLHDPVSFNGLENVTLLEGGVGGLTLLFGEVNGDPVELFPCLKFSVRWPIPILWWLRWTSISACPTWYPTLDTNIEPIPTNYRYYELKTTFISKCELTSRMFASRRKYIPISGLIVVVVKLPTVFGKHNIPPCRIFRPPGWWCF